VGEGSQLVRKKIRGGPVVIRIVIPEETRKVTRGTGAAEESRTPLTTCAKNTNKHTRVRGGGRGRLHGRGQGTRENVEGKTGGRLGTIHHHKGGGDGGG